MAFNRRSLLLKSALLTVSQLGCDAPAEKKLKTSALKKEVPVVLQRQDKALICLAAVAGVLLPDDGKGPSAASLGAKDYLKKALLRADLKQVSRALASGAQSLDDWAYKIHQKHFVALDAQTQHEAVQKMVDGKMNLGRLSGKQFTQVMMALTLEAALGDPRHGGNKDQKGWQWLGYNEAGRG